MLPDAAKQRDGRGAVLDAEFAENAFDVRLYRPPAEAENHRNLGIGLPGDEPVEDFRFTGSQSHTRGWVDATGSVGGGRLRNGTFPLHVVLCSGDQMRLSEREHEAFVVAEIRPVAGES